MARAMLLTALFLPSCLAASDTSAGSRSGISGSPVFERAWGHGRERDCILAALRPILPHRGEAHPARLARPDSSSREPQSSAIAGAREREPRKSRLRARIEHVFGAQQNSPGGRIVRTIGIARAKAKIGLQNLAYNIRRLVMLDRIAAA
jgi:hypothetical protein